jgi:hypothetical protein
MNPDMRSNRRGVGRPLIAAMALLCGWVAIRASTWEPPFPLPASEALFAQAEVRAPTRSGVSRADAASDSSVANARHARPLKPLRSELGALILSSRKLGADANGHDMGTRAVFASGGPTGPVISARAGVMARHQALFASAMSYASGFDMPILPSLANPALMTPGKGGGRLPLGGRAGTYDIAASAPVPTPSSAGPAGPGRWSGDAWLMIREGRAYPQLTGVNPASYGGDQAGAVVRYAVAPDSPLAPHIYGRVSKALVSGGESEAAVGASLSLARNFPLRVHGEVRVTDRTGSTEVRPAAYVVTGVPRRSVAPNLVAEGYLQAGYVGGKFDTGFVDGKATLQASVLSSGHSRFTIGGGAWGGAQRDASRLDVGPTASVNLSTGGTTLRASVDYRVRVAGDARPGNGVAVTIAASF